MSARLSISARKVLASPTPLATLWYPWFGFDMDTGESIGGLGSSHWNTDAGSYGSRVGVTDEPVWGFYASDDRDVIAPQVEAMRRASINTILVSWWGWGDSDLDGVIDSPEGLATDRAVRALLDYLASSGAPLKVAFMVEPFMQNARDLTTDKQQELVDYVWNDYYSRYPGLLFQWDGKPLLGTFFPLDLSGTEDSRVTFRMWGSSNDPNWKAYQPFQWNGYPDVDTLEMQVSDDGVIVVFPRFDEYWAWIMGWKPDWQPRRIDPLLKDQVYERAWQVCIDNRKILKLIIVYSWNEHGDHSAIEPTKQETPLAAGWTLVDKTSEYYKRFVTGKDER